MCRNRSDSDVDFGDKDSYYCRIVELVVKKAGV